MLSLLASGFSSSVVGTMAGAAIMQDFVHFRIPLWFRRLTTLLPALWVAWIGTDPTQALILSQVILSLVLPIPMFAVIWFSSQRRFVGEFSNRLPTTLVACGMGSVVLALNLFLLIQTLHG
jgi:manganese transport protein